MKYFRFKPTKDSGKIIILREKKTVHDKPKETYISKKGSLMLFGIEASGKSHKLQTIVRNADEIWSKETKIVFKATDSLSEILLKNLENDIETKKLLTKSQVVMSDDDEEYEAVDYKKQYVKFEALMQKAKTSVLIIDDIDRMTGKKLELTKDLMRHCKRFVITAKSEESINRTLRNIMNSRKMNIATVQLTSNASVDATNILFALFILGLFVGGLPEAAMLIAAGRFAMRGTK